MREWGAPGSGRSHLLQATVAAVLARGGSAAAVAGVDAAPLDPDLWRLDCVAVDDVGVVAVAPDQHVAVVAAG